MNLSIRPTKSELRDARQKVETVWKSYEYSIEVEEPEIYLNWQKLDRAATLVSAEEEIVIAIDPDKEYDEELEDAVLIGVLEQEFMQKARYGEIEFHWQEIAKMSYVKHRQSELAGKEFAQPELTADWRLLRQEIEEDEEFSEELYENASIISARIAEEIENAEEAVKFRKSDVLELGDELFG